MPYRSTSSSVNSCTKTIEKKQECKVLGFFAEEVKQACAPIPDDLGGDV